VKTKIEERKTVDTRRRNGGKEHDCEDKDRGNQNCWQKVEETARKEKDCEDKDRGEERAKRLKVKKLDEKNEADGALTFIGNAIVVSSGGGRRRRRRSGGGGGVFGGGGSLIEPGSFGGGVLGGEASSDLHSSLPSALEVAERGRNAVVGNGGGARSGGGAGVIELPLVKGISHGDEEEEEDEDGD
jgi:hypothetical protein